MKKISSLLILSLIMALTIFYSCKKETSCKDCKSNNKPPIAMAGPDQVIKLPIDSVSLDGRSSSDPDGTITTYQWTKISGPASFSTRNASTVTTVVKNLTEGIYKFELNVKDDGGLSAKDTVQITVNSATQLNHPPAANAGSNRPSVNVQLTP